MLKELQATEAERVTMRLLGIGARYGGQVYHLILPGDKPNRTMCNFMRYPDRRDRPPPADICLFCLEEFRKKFCQDFCDRDE